MFETLPIVNDPLQIRRIPLKRLSIHFYYCSLEKAPFNQVHFDAEQISLLSFYSKHKVVMNKVSTYYLENVVDLIDSDLIFKSTTIK